MLLSWIIMVCAMNPVHASEAKEFLANPGIPLPSLYERYHGREEDLPLKKRTLSNVYQGYAHQNDRTPDDESDESSSGSEIDILN